MLGLSFGGFAKKLETFFTECLSYHHMAQGPEKFLHGLMLGALVSDHPIHSLKSSREAGKGRYDISMEPIRTSGPGFILELKKRMEAWTTKRVELQILSCERAPVWLRYARSSCKGADGPLGWALRKRLGLGVAWEL